MLCGAHMGFQHGPHEDFVHDALVGPTWVNFNGPLWPHGKPTWGPPGQTMGCLVASGPLLAYMLGLCWGESVFVRCSQLGPNWASPSGLQLGLSWARHLADDGPTSLGVQLG